MAMLDFLRVFNGGKAILPNKEKILSDNFILGESRLGYIKGNQEIVKNIF